jgi:hypothetical protein
MASYTEMHRLVDEQAGRECVLNLHTVKGGGSIRDQVLAFKAAAGLQGCFMMKRLPAAESAVYRGSDKRPAIKQDCDAVETMYDSNVAKLVVSPASRMFGMGRASQREWLATAMQQAHTRP